MIRATLLAMALSLTGMAAWAQDEAVWTFQNDGDEAYLVYGIPDSDDGRLVLSCAKGSGRVTVMAPVEHRVPSRLDDAGQWRDAQGRANPWPTGVVLSSGVVIAKAQGQADPDEMNGGSTVNATFPATGAVLTAFGRTGVLHLSAYGQTVREPPVPAKTAAAFLKTCG